MLLKLDYKNTHQSSRILSLHLILLVLPTLIFAASVFKGDNNDNVDNDNGPNKLITSNLTSNNANSFNNKSFALIQGTKLERETTSSGWQINAGVYLEKSIGDGHSTMWESSSDDDDSSDDEGGTWGLAKGAKRIKKKNRDNKKFSMLSHNDNQPINDVESVVNGTSRAVNGSGPFRLYIYEGVVSVENQANYASDGELNREMDKFKLKKQHSWTEGSIDNGVGDAGGDDDDDVMKSDANSIWNKMYDLAKLYLFVIWIVFEG